MKKTVILLLLSLSLTGCNKNKEIAETPKQLTISDNQEPYIKKSVISEDKVVSKNEPAKQEKPVERPKIIKENDYTFKVTYISLEGYHYKCSIDKENQRINVEFREENITGKLDLETFNRLQTLMDYIEEDRERYKNQALEYGFAEGSIDIEGWLGDLLYSFAKGTNIDDRKENYYTHAIECLEDMEAIMGIQAPKVSENDTTDYKNYQDHTVEDIRINTTRLGYGICAYVTDIKCISSGDIAESPYGKYRYFNNGAYYTRSVITDELNNNGYYIDIVGHEEMSKAWDYFTAGSIFPLPIADKYLIGYSIDDSHISHIQPLMTTPQGNNVEISLKTGVQESMSGQGEFFVLPLDGSIESFSVKQDDYYKETDILNPN